MIQIPFEKIPAQTLSIDLDDYFCEFTLEQRGDYMYMNIKVDGEYLFTGVCCLTNRWCNLYKRKEFNGILFWNDNTGNCGIPNYEELGDRYCLYYISEETDVIHN